MGEAWESGRLSAAALGREFEIQMKT